MSRANFFVAFVEDLIFLENWQKFRDRNLKEYRWCLGLYFGESYTHVCQKFNAPSTNLILSAQINCLECQLSLFGVWEKWLGPIFL